MKVLFIEKIKCAARSGVRLIAGGAIDRNLACVRSYDVHSVVSPCQLRVRSIVGVAFDRTAFDCKICDRLHVTASEVPRRKWVSDGGKGNVWNAGLRGCAQSRPLGSSAMRSIAPSALDRTIRGQDFNVCSITPFWTPICTNDLQHTKTLKQHKILDIDTTKSLTNIS